MKHFSSFFSDRRHETCKILFFPSSCSFQIASQEKTFFLSFTSQSFSFIEFFFSWERKWKLSLAPFPSCNENSSFCSFYSEKWPCFRKMLVREMRKVKVQFSWKIQATQFDVKLLVFDFLDSFFVFISEFISEDKSIFSFNIWTGEDSRL